MIRIAVGLEEPLWGFFNSVEIGGRRFHSSFLEERFLHASSVSE
jgi:hypothetical protein